MASKKNEPKIKPSSMSSSSTEDKPNQNPEEILVENSGKVESSESTPFDSNKSTSSGFEGSYGAGVWNNNKKIQGLWSKAETRNSWINLTDLGWKKINNPTDTTVTAMTIIAASGISTQSSVNVLLENNLIHEIYLW